MNRTATVAAEVRSPGATWADLYELAAGALGKPNEARWMIQEVSGERSPCGRAQEAARRRLAGMLERRLAGEPLQYILGSWAFRTLDLTVDPRVLIPRPETEQVVEVALQEIDRVGARVVVDLGTGSGAIALSIAKERPAVEVWATDSSAEALQVARANAAGQDATGVTLVEGHWWDALPSALQGRVDVVVSNPPYVSTAEMPGLDGWEPRKALEAGPSGLEAVEEILAGARGWLRESRATAVIEIAPRQAAEAARAALAAGLVEVEVRKDLAGRDRVLVSRTTHVARGGEVGRRGSAKG